jgi:hypothetical protein
MGATSSKSPTGNVLGVYSAIAPCTTLNRAGGISNVVSSAKILLKQQLHLSGWSISSFSRGTQLYCILAGEKGLKDQGRVHKWDNSHLFLAAFHEALSMTHDSMENVESNRII